MKNRRRKPIRVLSPKDILAAGRLIAVRFMPYYKRALQRLIFIECPGLGTFSTTKKMVTLWDPAVVQKYGIYGAAAMLLHEVQHPLRRTYDRAGTRHWKKWNLASDIPIEDDLQPIYRKLIKADSKCRPLIEAGFTSAKVQLPPHKTAEEYYALLPDFPSKPEGCGCHDPELEKKAQELLGNEEESLGEIGLSDFEIDLVRRQVARDVQDAEARDPGSVPSNLKRWAHQQLQPPVIRWQDEAARAGRRSLATRSGMVDYRYDRPNRRQFALQTNVILPRMVAPDPKITVAIDTSGSMALRKELLEAVSECAGIFRAFGKPLQLLTCDAEVHESRVVGNIADLVRKGLLGGGGTNFFPIFKHLQQQPVKPDLLYVFTDGCGPAPSKPLPWPTIWILVGPYAKSPCSWGRQIYTNPQKRRIAPPLRVA